jgi:hypothetical protein
LGLRVAGVRAGRWWLWLYAAGVVAVAIRGRETRVVGTWS